MPWIVCRTDAASAVGSPAVRATTDMPLNGVLIERDVHRRRGVGLEAGVANVPDDADDLVEAVRAVADVDALSDGIAVREVTVGELLIDDRDHGRLLAIAHGERPAAQQRDAESLEVVRARDAIVRRGSFIGLWCGLPLDGEGEDVVAPHRQRLRHAGGGDIGQRLEPLEQPREEGNAV